MIVFKLTMLAPLAAMLLWAALSDARTRRIPNWLTLSLVLAGLIQSFMPHALVTPVDSLAGLLVGFFVPFVLYLLRGLGAGDVKLLAGIGAWVGPWPVIAIFGAAAVLGLAVVLILCICQRRLGVLLRNTAVLVLNLLHVRKMGLTHIVESGQAFRSIGRPMPYAVFVLIGTIGVVTASLFQITWGSI